MHSHLNLASHTWLVATLSDSVALVPSDLHRCRGAQVQPGHSHFVTGKASTEPSQIFMSPSQLAARMDQPSHGGYELLISKIEEEKGTASRKSVEHLPCTLALCICGHMETLHPLHAERVIIPILQVGKLRLREVR